MANATLRRLATLAVGLGARVHTFDREIIAWNAISGAVISGSDVRDMMASRMLTVRGRPPRLAERISGAM